MDSFSDRWSTYLKERADCGLLRRLRPAESGQPGFVSIAGKRVLDLSSNDYLGFARERFETRCESPGTGAGASRLVVGDHPLHHRLEETIARSKGTEGALLYPSGYQANVGLLSSLANRDTTVIADRLNHASLVDGAKLSGARLVRYAHGNVGAARDALEACRDRPALLVTDSVFSMDGDIAPLPELLDLAVRYGALLVVDEAHATGVLGPHGAGAWHAAGLPVSSDTPVVLMGTLSKAIGCQGGFVCGSRLLIDYLINTSRAFIYSTGLSPVLAAGALAAFERLQADPGLLDKLAANARCFREALQAAGVETGRSGMPIVPVRVGEAQRAVEVSERLLERGILGVAIRPPTVPEGTSRLRFTVTAAHDRGALAEAARDIGEIVRRCRG